jgi:transposase
MLVTATLPADLAVLVTAIGSQDDGAVRVALGSARDTVPCPECGTPATRVHSRYPRTLGDLPWQGLTVRLELETRRFFCAVATCPRRIFGERFAGLTLPHGRRSERLDTLFTSIGLALGGEAGARMAADLGLSISPDTLLRLVRAVPMAEQHTPRVLGVDDWALRRGRTYGTVLVDLERHQLVDLLPDRTADTLAAWLRAHPGVEIISRDRASAYADGGRQGAPDAVQVADRWHLLKNVGDALEQFLRGQATALRAAMAVAEGDDAASDALPSTPSDKPEEPVAPDHAAAESTASPATAPTRGTSRLQARYTEVMALHEQGLTIRAISRRTGFARVTIRKYLRAASCPERAPRGGLLFPGSRWETRLRERWDAGCHNAAVLWAELRAEGFPGSAGHIRRHIGGWRPVPGRRGRPPRAELEPTTTAAAAPVRPPSPRQVRWWLLEPLDTRSAEHAAYVACLAEHCPAAPMAEQVAHEFGRLVRERDADAFDAWLTTAATSGIPELRGVATGMRRDYAAITAGLRLPWSNGQTEGQVTKIKLVKRLMYGRGKIDLLRRRVMRVA